MSQNAASHHDGSWAVFLDVDGTILEIASTPQDVYVPASLKILLNELCMRLDGALALITGRSLADLDRLLSPLRRPIDNGRWIAIVPGRYTTAIALFSLEPSMQQFTHIQDLHRDFERANRLTLEHGIRAPEQLVFPHRALFEGPGE